MTELSFAAGQRATLDLRDSTGEVAVKDWDEPTIRVASTSETSPFVLRDEDTFRIRLEQGGAITVPVGVPVEALVPSAVQLRVMRVTRSGGETVVRHVPAPAESASIPRAAEGAATVPDIAEFTRVMSEQGRRILQEMTRAVSASGVGVPGDVAERVDEAALRIDEQVRRVAERVQREVESVVGSASRVEERARQAAERAAERAERAARRMETHAREREERASRRGGRGRWWFTERLDEWAAANAANAGHADRPGSAATATASPSATSDERRTILDMLKDGKITSDQAARLLEALGG